MKILVCISNVPDTTTKVKFVEDNTKLDTMGIQWVINPWDELSLTRALELKEKPEAGVDKVTVINVGEIGSEPTIRKALAIGADDAIRVNADPNDAYFVAAQLADAIKEEGFDIILCGIESSDFNGSAVGSMLSEFLDIPSVSAVSSLDIDGGKVVLTRDIDGGKELVEVPTPLVAVAQKGIADEPRIAAMRGIMMARSKPIKVIEPASVEPLTEVLAYEMPEKREACKFVEADEAGKLIGLLQSEAKVL